MSSRSGDTKFVAYNLRETYAELGEYEFKVVLSPKHFKNSHSSELSLRDSDGKTMRHEVNRWGRKMNCKFTIDDDCSDGVAACRLVLRDDRGRETVQQLTFWIIK